MEKWPDITSLVFCVALKCGLVFYKVEQVVMNKMDDDDLVYIKANVLSSQSKKYYKFILLGSLIQLGAPVLLDKCSQVYPVA